MHRSIFDAASLTSGKGVVARWSHIKAEMWDDQRLFAVSDHKFK